MYNFKFSGTLVALGCWLLLQIFILPIGCSTAPGPVGPVAGSPSLPVYELGTTYVYSNGSWETVADISPQSAIYSKNNVSGWSKNLLRSGRQGSQWPMGYSTSLRIANIAVELFEDISKIVAYVQGPPG